MTSGELIELAAFIAANAPLLIQSERGLPSDSIAQYWSAAKCRQQRWAQAVKQLSCTVSDAAVQKVNASRAAPARPRQTLDAFSLLQEIFESEVLTRVWTAVVALHDRQRKTSDAEPVARSVFMGQLEARRRALKLLMHGPGINAHDAVDLNRLRRRAERWNDMFIGYLSSIEDVLERRQGADTSGGLNGHDAWQPRARVAMEFAFDADLAAEFADDFHARPAERNCKTGWAIVMASLKSGARAAPSLTSPNQDLNQQIGAAILGCFAGDAFDSLGLPRSLWAVRVLHSADSARGLIEQLFAAERQPPPSGRGFIIRR